MSLPQTSGYRSSRMAGRALTASAAVMLAMLSGCSGHGKYTQAHKDRAEQKINGLKAASLWDQARQAYLVGELDKAMVAIDESINANSEVPKSFVLRGRILLELGNYDQSIASFNQAITLDPDNAAGQAVEAHYYTGVAHEQIGQRQEALDCFLKANELDPASAQYAVAAAEVMIDLDRVGGAEAFLLSRPASFENNAGVKQTLGHIAMLKGEPDHACDLFTQARLLAPEDACLIEDLARAQVQAGRYAEAEFNLAKLLENPENADRRDLAHLQARCLVEVDRPVEARTVLVALTSDDEGNKDLDAWMELGHISYVLGDPARVKQCAARVIALSPRTHEGYLLRALALRQEGDFPGALAALDSAVQYRGTDTSPLILRGLVAQQSGQIGIARTSFRDALASDPSNTQIRELLDASYGRASGSTIVEVPEDSGR
jgi:tetratricopeptide (TPR) repeat protein